MTITFHNVDMPEFKGVRCWVAILTRGYLVNAYQRIKYHMIGVN